MRGGLLRPDHTDFVSRASDDAVERRQRRVFAEAGFLAEVLTTDHQASYRVLEGLPAGARIVAARVTNVGPFGEIRDLPLLEVLVDHHTFDVVAEGALAPVMDVTLGRVHDTRTCHVCRAAVEPGADGDPSCADVKAHKGCVHRAG